MDAREIKVVMLPWLAHGHISPFLELAKRLTSRKFIIYICSTPINLKSIKKKLTQKHSKQIRLVELHLPPSTDLPPHSHTTNGLPPHLLPTLQQSFRKAGPQFSDVVSRLNPDLVVYDYCQPWAARVASAAAIPAVQFLTISAAMMLHIIYAFERPGENFPFREISLREPEEASFRALNSSGEADELLEAFQLSNDVVLMKTGREIEGRYVDFLSSASGKRVIPVGALVQNAMNVEMREIMQWLEKKEKKKSVVFVSFGSEYFLPHEGREEVAKGLEMSTVNFIWVVKFPNGKQPTTEEALPRGFLDRVGDRGLVIEGWAPQARILRHPSIGGFVSHCGWNSTLESVKSGVPIIAMPMRVDQPVNARLVEATGVGAEVVRDGKGKFRGEEIAKVIRKVVLDEDGEVLRKKTREMSDKLRDNVDQAVEHFAIACKKNKYTY